SFAAPMWAGYMALVNEQYLLNGASTTLGFINPALYDIYAGSNYGTDFHNVTSGGNTLGCTVGYSLSCGLGSPHGNALVNALAVVATGPTVTVSPASLLWGDIVLGKTGSGKAVTLTNTGTSTLNISSIDQRRLCPDNQHKALRQ